MQTDVLLERKIDVLCGTNANEATWGILIRQKAAATKPQAGCVGQLVVPSIEQYFVCY